MAKFKPGDRVQAYQKKRDKMVYGTVVVYESLNSTKVWVDFDELVTGQLIDTGEDMTVDGAYVDESELELLSVKEWESIWESGTE